MENKENIRRNIRKNIAYSLPNQKQIYALFQLLFYVYFRDIPMSLSIHAKMCIIHIYFLSCNTFSFSLIKSVFLKLLQTPGKQTLLDFIFLEPLNGFTDSMDMGMSKLRDGQGSLACSSPRGHKGLDMTKRLNFRFIARLSRRYRGFPCNPSPHTCSTSPVSNISHQSGR